MGFFMGSRQAESKNKIVSQLAIEGRKEGRKEAMSVSESVMPLHFRSVRLLLFCVLK